MDFRVEIKDPAIADLAEIVSYIAQDNPVKAQNCRVSAPLAVSTSRNSHKYVEKVAKILRQDLPD